MNFLDMDVSVIAAIVSSAAAMIMAISALLFVHELRRLSRSAVPRIVANARWDEKGRLYVVFEIFNIYPFPIEIEAIHAFWPLKVKLQDDKGNGARSVKVKTKLYAPHSGPYNKDHTTEYCTILPPPSWKPNKAGLLVLGVKIRRPKPEGVFVHKLRLRATPYTQQTPS